MPANVESMAYVGAAAPWHGIGVPLAAPPTIVEAIAKSGLDWRVEKQRLVTEGGVRTDRFAVVRTDTNEAIGVVGEEFEHLQNAEAFEFFQTYIDARQATIETAGSLAGGRRVWVLARLTQIDAADVVPGDPIEPYMLLANGHDGSLAVSLCFTPTRVVCENTLSRALDGAVEGRKIVRAVHRPGVRATLDAVKQTVDVARRSFDASMDAYRRLAERKVPSDELGFIAAMREMSARALFGSPYDAVTEERAASVDGAVVDIERLMQGGRAAAVQGARGTWWSAYNALNEKLNHERSRTVSSRVDSLWFGPAATIDRRALSAALELSA